METNAITGKPFDYTTENLIVKRKALKPVLYAAFFALLGAAFLFMAAGLEDKTSSAYMGLSVLGWAGIGVGILKILVGCNRKVYKPTGSPLSGYSVFFNVADLSDLKQALESKGFGAIKKIEGQDAKSARLDLLVSKDGQFATAQLYEYIPYTYRPASSIYRFTDEEAVRFSETIVPMVKQMKG